MEKLLSQIIALTKNIHLKTLASDKKGIEQFCVGKRDPFALGGGFVISWKYTDTAFKLVENISFLIQGNFEEFSECDHKSIQDTIKSTFHEICVDDNIYSGDDVCFARKEVLFDCRINVDVTAYAQSVLECVLENIRSTISEWCILYTAPRIRGISFSVESEGIDVIDKCDKSPWQRIISEGFPLDAIRQESGMFSDGHYSAFSQLKFDYYFIARAHGTSQGSKFSSSLKLRKLLSVIYAITDRDQKWKVAAKPHSYSIQIPHLSSDIGSTTMSEIGELLPYYGMENVLEHEDVDEILRWYKFELESSKAQKNRIEKCAHFINKGMNSDDVDSYIHYFVALDALFGKRGSVERSIKDGVSLLTQNYGWNEKISWLIDLRNELVHGGSRFIGEWPKYMKYYRHFSTEPSRDMEQLAFLALKSAPNILV